MKEELLVENGDLNWGEAEEHLCEIESQYLNLMGRHGVNTSFFFHVVLPPIRGRFNNGIRDEKLYLDIMELK